MLTEMKRINIFTSNYDKLLLAVVVCILMAGYIMVTSASIYVAADNYNDPFFYSKRQAVYIMLCLSSCIVMSFIPSDFWRSISGWVLGLGLLGLLAVFIPGLGKEVNNSVRWISLGGLNFQPSEFAKIALVIFAAGFLVRRMKQVRTQFIHGFGKLSLVLGIYGALLLMEPDLGTALVMGVSVIGMLFLGGMRLSHVAIAFTVAVIIALVAAYLSPYRALRMITFLEPWNDPYGDGYQITQALIALGQGGWFGQGLGNSLQKLHYLPEAHTDFLFAILVEELGAVGGMILVALYIFFIVRGFRIGQKAEALKCYYSAYLSYGLVIIFACQAVVIVFVNLNLSPVKGIPLPLFSYGGSSLLMSGCAIGLLLRISMENQAMFEAQVPFVEHHQSAIQSVEVAPDFINGEMYSG